VSSEYDNAAEGKSRQTGEEEDVGGRGREVENRGKRKQEGGKENGFN